MSVLCLRVKGTTYLSLARFIKTTSRMWKNTFSVRFVINYTPIVKNVMQNSPIVGNGVGTIVGDGDGTGVGSARQGPAINRGTEGGTPSLLFQMFSDLLMMFMTLN